MQSWGYRSRFNIRDTGLEPSRSGVIGLLCAGLGRDRGEPLDDLAGLRMAVRVDHEGVLARDYQTCMVGPGDTIVSPRDYLADADFLVGLEGEQALLQRLDTALRRPVWTLYLGRKSFVPSMPIAAGVHDGDLLTVLQRWPHPGGRLRFVRESATGEARQDVPLSFAERTFGVRRIQTEFLEVQPCT